jgi:two-component system chemotaxis response regulator CheY
MAGFHISGTAKNGIEAVELYKTCQNKPEIILMDHRMPLKNGLDAMKEIIQYDNSAKVIFTSADHVIEKEARREGAIEFLLKPFSNSYLIKKIKMLIPITQY